MTAGTFSHSGQDSLDAMRPAKRYNAFLPTQIEGHAPQDRHMLDFWVGLGLFASMPRDRG